MIHISGFYVGTDPTLKHSIINSINLKLNTNVITAAVLLAIRLYTPKTKQKSL